MAGCDAVTRSDTRFFDCVTRLTLVFCWMIVIRDAMTIDMNVDVCVHVLH